MKDIIPFRKIIAIVPLVCIFFNFSGLLQAQGIPPQTITDTTTVLADIDLLEESLTNVEYLRSGVTDEVVETTITLVQGELHMTYKLNDSRSEEQVGHEYEVRMVIHLNNAVLEIRPDKILGEYGFDLNTDNTAFEKTLIITDLVEKYVSLKGELVIYLIVKHEFTVDHDLENFNCDNPPVFSFKQQIPFIALGITGTGLIVSGLVINNQAKKDYDENYALHVDEELAEEDYNRANDDHQLAQVLMIGGGIILVADGVWFYLKSRDHKKRKDLFETYCSGGNPLSFQPTVQFPDISMPSGSLGLSLTYTF